MLVHDPFFFLGGGGGGGGGGQIQMLGYTNNFTAIFCRSWN